MATERYSHNEVPAVAGAVPSTHPYALDWGRPKKAQSGFGRRGRTCKAYAKKAFRSWASPGIA